jgi:hypothetical protein
VSFGDWLAPAGLIDHVGERKAREVLAHVISHVSPHAEKYALALVVTRAVLVGLAEVASGDRSIHGGDNLSQSYGFGGPGEDVPASDAAFRSDQSHALQTEQDLLKIGLGESGALSEVTHRGRQLIIVTEGQTQ